MGKFKLVCLGLTASAALVAGCGATSPASTPTPTESAATAAPTPTPSPTADIPALGAQFLALLVPLNPAFTVMNNYLIGSKGQSFAQVAAHVAPFVASLRTFDAGILAMHWPAQFLADAHELVTADGVWEGNLSGAAHMTDYDTWLSAGESAVDGARSAAAIVRSDLGLPARVPGKSVY